jgi:hypothetical protein
MGVVMNDDSPTFVPSFLRSLRSQPSKKRGAVRVNGSHWVAWGEFGFGKTVFEQSNKKGIADKKLVIVV